METVDSEFFATCGNILSGKHSGIRGRFVAIGLHFHPAGNAADCFSAAEVGNVDEGIIEAGEYTCDAKDIFTCSIVNSNAKCS